MKNATQQNRPPSNARCTFVVGIDHHDTAKSIPQMEREAAARRMHTKKARAATAQA